MSTTPNPAIDNDAAIVRGVDAGIRRNLPALVARQEARRARAATPRPIRNPDARLRLLRRAAAVIDDDPVGILSAAVAFTPRLAARGLAVTHERLLEYAYHLRTHRAIEDGTEDPLDLLDEDASYVDADATRAALTREFEARVHADERLIAGITRPL